MQNTGQQLLHTIHQQREEMVSLLAELVSAESPSASPEAQAVPLALLWDIFDQLGYELQHTPGRNSGGYLVARHPRAKGVNGRQLLAGHSDTVWPVGTLDHMPLQIEDNRMRGPGVFDMKGGLVQMIFALRALATLDLEPLLAPVVLITTDEEIGSLESRDVIVELAQEAERALILEPASGLTGRLKTSRKGVGQFEVVVSGRAAHAGLDPEKGISAILGMAHVIQELHALTNLDRGVTVNVGLVEGGLQPNVIAPESRAVVDVRVPTVRDAEEVEAVILAMEAPLPDTTVEISGGINRPPLEPTAANRALWHLARDAGTEMGLTLEDCGVGGGSDGNYTSLYTATLDGLGAVGDGAHADHEFIYIDKMIERSALLARLLLTEP